MKKNLFYAASLLLAAATFAGCSNEEDASLQQDAFSVEAGIGFQQSRTTLQDDDETVVWSKGDQIYLFGGNSNATMTLVEGEGKTTGTFRGGVNGFTSQLTHALYPVPTVSGNAYSFNFPAEITYSENSNAPMLGDYTDGSVQFENLTAMVRIPLKNLDASKENVVTLTMAGITGTATVNVEEGTLEFPTTGMGNAVTVTIPAGVTECFVDVPVPAKAYDGFEVKLNGNVIASKTFDTAKELTTEETAIVTLGVIGGEDSELTPEEDGSYVITDAAGLIRFAQQVNSGETFKDETVKLGADIDLAGFDWTPIGDCKSGKYFQGTFDGNDKTISNLYVDKSTDEYKNSTAGLFGWIDAGMATIKNVKVDNATVKGSHWTGVIAGYATGRIENCTVSNSTVEGCNVNEEANGDKIGGIVGYLNEHSYLNRNKVTDTTIKGNRDLGGIAGAVAASTKEMENNIVNNVALTYYTTKKDYSSAGEIVSGRTGYQPNNTNVATNVTKKLVVTTAAQLQIALDNAVDGEYIVFADDITGNVTVTQKPDVKITIDGEEHQFVGAIIVDGKSARYETAGLSIKNVNFCGGCDKDAYINLGDGTNINATRYTNNVTVEGCNFDFDGSKDLVAVKSYTGGDRNLTLSGCEASAGMHSLLQVTNVEQNLKITDCKAYSKNGININNTPSLVMDGCTFDTKGYAVRLGVNGTVDGEDKSFEIKNSTLQSACEDGDAVVIFRDNAKKANLTLDNTSVIGVLHFSGDSEANIEVK